jgi:hypothetical protein
MPSIELAALRVVKVPDSAPPYDCEAHGADCPARREQADDTASWAMPRADTARGPGAPGPAANPGHGIPAGHGGLTGHGGPGDHGGPVAAMALPRQLARAVVEILAGVRPMRQAIPWATDHAIAQLRGLTPRFASGRQPRIQRIVTSRPAADVVEMTVIVGLGPRTHAVAMRFEHVPARRRAPGLPPRPARWLCTALETG